MCKLLYISKKAVFVCGKVTKWALVPLFRMPGFMLHSTFSGTKSLLHRTERKADEPEENACHAADLRKRIALP